jgi:predicted kinase
MMVGLVASGKSTKSKELAIEHDAIIFSSDDLREELFGDINDQEHNQELFVELHRRIKNCLRSGKNAIMDATNINYKKRMAFLAELKGIPCEKICVLMATPYETCVRRNHHRERRVPDHVLKRMYFGFNIPYRYEGWNDIQIVYSDGAENSYGDVHDWAESMIYRDQHNSHHRLTLGQHCIKTFLDVCKTEKRNWNVAIAALIHDCGKPSTATFVNSKGIETDECHYYSHQYTGSYDSLFFSGVDNHLYVAILIMWHMQPYFWEKDNNEKLHNKYRKLWGEVLYQDIMQLHTADKFSH